MTEETEKTGAGNSIDRSIEELEEQIRQYRTSSTRTVIFGFGITGLIFLYAVFYANFGPYIFRITQLRYETITAIKTLHPN